MSGGRSQDDGEERLTPGAQRILDVASDLFYWRGINAVGVDTIAAESGVTKRTLYDRFGSKERLVAAYLRTRDRRWRQLIATRLEDEDLDLMQRVLVPFDVLDEWLVPNGRGCSFINAFAELPELEHPGRQIVVAEKTWLRDLFGSLLREAGVPDPTSLAVQLLSLHEGALVAHAIAGQTDAASKVRQAAETLVLAAARP
ncbi:MAG: TetR family transcriptional regulator [Pseudonocardia sp.]|nr:TetR family transcriptional regulator [Pseudonocardia sp.]